MQFSQNRQGLPRTEIDQIDTGKLSPNTIFLISSVLLVILIYGVFIAQKLFSDVVTFSAVEDAMRQTLPMFIRTGNLLRDGIFDGADVLITNGANSIHGWGPEWFVLYRPFALLGAILGAQKFFYFLMFASISFLNLFLSQKLFYEFFNISVRVSHCCAVMLAASLLCTSWFDTFFIIGNMTLPCIYIVLKALHSRKRWHLIFASAGIALAFYTGYVTISCIMALIVFLISGIYLIFWNDTQDIKQKIWHLLLSTGLGTAVSLPYLLWAYMTTRGNTGSMLTLPTAVDLSVSFKDLLSIFLTSDGASIPEGDYLYLGPVILLILFLFCFCAVTREMPQKYKVFFWIGLGVNLLLLLVEAGHILPLGKWFYMLPYFGGMHIRTRYMLVTWPLLFLALGIGVSFLPKDVKKKTVIGALASTLAVLGTIVVARRTIVDYDFLILEGCMLLVAVLILFQKKVPFKYLLLFCCACYFLITTESFYDLQEVTTPKSSFIERSIAYDSDAQKEMDTFISGLPERELYKYIGLEADGAVPGYVMNNYSWYGIQQYPLSNYLKYPLHGGAIPTTYSDEISMYWFNNYDWNYLFDTKIDFVTLTQSVIDENPELYNNLIDWDYTPRYLRGEYCCVKVKSYIPRHYTGGDERVPDSEYSLNNGYFYAPNLVDEDIVSFYTNAASEFEITLNAPEPTEVQFSLFAVDNYTYYVDGAEYQPEIDNGLAYFSTAEGEHTIRISYKDRAFRVVHGVYSLYFGCVTICGLILLAQWVSGGVSKNSTTGDTHIRQKRKRWIAPENKDKKNV